ncbi:MAG: hypothetical protein IJQ34_07505 [Kiritimatiellae bacterium]|nr:hypothetical protein [Kiritimatiellia bacterium]
MTEEVKKGVIIEFDFAVVNGAQILFDTTKKLLNDVEIPFDKRVEAFHLAGGNYQGGLAEYFAEIKTKKTAQKAAKDISTTFSNALTKTLPGSVTEDFRAFLRILLERGLKVVVATRAHMDEAKKAFAEFMENPDFALYQEVSSAYGCVKWDAWRRAAAAHHLRSFLTIAVAGSGLSVKSALLAGVGAFAVMNEHVAYQDFSGVDEIVDKVDANLAEKIAAKLKA